MVTAVCAVVGEIVALLFEKKFQTLTSGEFRQNCKIIFIYGYSSVTDGWHFTGKCCFYLDTP